MPVLSREFGSIVTEIRDDTGRPVPFERGKVTVTLHFRRAAPGYSDELRRLLCEAGGWGTALLYRRSCPDGARIWKFVQWSHPIGCPSDQTRCLCVGEACADDWSADCQRCRGWSERQEGSKTKGKGCRKRPDGKPPQHTTTSR